MIIKYENYSMELDKGRYNLSKTITRKKLDGNKEPTGETYEVEYVIGYGFKLENAVKRIIDDKLEKVEAKVDLMEFIDAYTKEVDLIYKITNGI